MTPEDIAYLRERAAASGYNPADLLKAIQYESSGREGVWGGKGKNYFGLIQFGPNERKTYGVNTAHPNARNQIDATMRFLADRGFKPGMGLLDLYSTINAGSPGHYKASDGNGTVESHVAAMSGQPVAASGGKALPIDALSFAATQADDTPSAKSDPIAEVLSQVAAEKKPEPVGGLLSQEQPENRDTEAFIRQMMDYHNARHMQAVQGLLGG